MSLQTAQNLAWNLATTFMAYVVLFRVYDGYGVLLASEFDGDASEIIHDYDPFQIMEG